MIKLTIEMYNLPGAFVLNYGKPGTFVQHVKKLRNVHSSKCICTTLKKLLKCTLIRGAFVQHWKTLWNAHSSEVHFYNN